MIISTLLMEKLKERKITCEFLLKCRDLLVTIRFLFEKFHFHSIENKMFIFLITNYCAAKAYFGATQKHTYICPSRN